MIYTDRSCLCTMDVLTLALITLLCYCIFYYFKEKLSFFKNRGIPYIPGWPFLGNFETMVLRNKHVFDVIREVYNVNREAKYVGFFDMTNPVIMLRDLELIKNVGIKNFDSLPDRTAFMDDSVDPILGKNLFTITGDKWREARSMLSPAFTGSKMKGMFELMVTCAESFVSHVKNLDRKQLRMVDTKDLFTRYTNDVIGTCAFGIRVDSLNDPNNEFYKLGIEVINLNSSGFMIVLFILSRYFPGVLRFFKIKFLKDHVADFFKTVIRETIKTREEKGIRRPDMIQLMMDARTKEHQHLKLDITEMTAQAFIFFFGGFETTSTQLSLVSHELAINPEIQAKLQAEVDQVLNSKKVTYEAIHEMPYLDAVFNESLRRHTQFIFLDRLCAKEFTLPPTLPETKPFTLKPGMTVWIPASAIHMDPTHYENPEKFDPERFFQKKSNATNLGFGIGPRACIGSRFATLEIKVLIFFILSKFSLRPNEKTSRTLEYDEKAFNNLRPKEGFWLTMEPRS